MTSSLKVLMSAIAGAAIAIALFVSVPANSDSRDPANARFAQDDLREPHNSRFAQANQDVREPTNAKLHNRTRVIRTPPGSRTRK